MKHIYNSFLCGLMYLIFPSIAHLPSFVIHKMTIDKTQHPGRLKQAFVSCVDYLNDRSRFWYIFGFALLLDLILSLLIVRFVKYTEIDWIAYMQEVEGFLGGDMNYANLRGDTGPLVYPAGFVYLYSCLYYITSKGTNILLAQYIFVGFYLACTAAAGAVLHKSRLVPTLGVLLICASKRVHSIFMLRCFNDGIAQLLFLIAVLAFLSNRWNIGCTLYSLAVSVKMNILLAAPALLLLLWQRFGFLATIPRLFICAAIQLVLAAPFLVAYPREYLKGAFDFGRVFTYKWTVNLKFLPEHVFTSRPLALALLATQLLLLALFARRAYAHHGGVLGLIKGPNTATTTTGDKKHTKQPSTPSPTPSQPSSARIVLLLSTSVLLGILCARSLHYQFYSWYFHLLPALLWFAPLPTWARLAIWVAIEAVWNVYPSRAGSALVLLGAHVMLVVGVWMGRWETLCMSEAEAQAEMMGTTMGGDGDTRSRVQGHGQTYNKAKMM